MEGESSVMMMGARLRRMIVIESLLLNEFFVVAAERKLGSQTEGSDNMDREGGW